MIVDMIEKIDSTRLSDVSTTPQIQQPGNVAAAQNPSVSNIKDSISVVQKPESIKPATDKLSEINTETLAQKQMNLQQAVEQINSELTSLQSEIGFSVDFETNKNIVTVTRKDSGEVVRQIPSETVLNVAHNIEKLKGVLFDKLI
jgi:flagellar protein FlaG